MKTILTTITGGFLAFSFATAAAADVRALSVTGVVRMAMPGNDVSQDVRAGQVLPVGAEIRTTENGRVTLEFGPGNTVRLRENGRLVISEPKAKETRIQFLAGRMKGVFSRLTGGQQFSIQFASGAVCSVKGTTLVIEETPEGFTVHTLFGVAEMSKDGAVTLVPQGCGAALGSGGGVQVATLSDKQIDEGLANWDSEAGSTDTRRADAAAEREALRLVVQDLKVEVQNSHETVANIKENDFAAGRTLKDIHGNIARVEQRIARPEPNHIQFINLVKRDTYAYAGKFQYSGSAGARLDYLQADAYLNIDMPETLTDWPQFFVDKAAAKADVHPTKMVLTLANGGSGDVNRDVFMNTVTFHEETRTSTYPTGSTWDPACNCSKETYATRTETEWRGLDLPTLNGVVITDDPNFDSDPYTSKGFDGETGSGAIWASSVWAIRPAKLDAAGNPVRTVATVDASGNTTHDGGELVADLDKAPMYVNFEGYLINNDGKNLAIADLTSGGQNPFEIIKNVAAEAVICVTDHPGTGRDLLGAGGHSNIDIIVTPDIVLSVGQKIAESGQLPDFGSDSSGSN